MVLIYELVQLYKDTPSLIEGVPNNILIFEPLAFSYY